MNRQTWLCAAATALAAWGCGDAASRESIEGPAASAQAKTIPLPATAPTSPSFPPWKQEADCYWVLTYPDGVAHRAWISGGEYGVFFNIVDDSMPSWPVSDSLPITFVADGASERSVTARGNHGDEDSATLLTVILDEPQRALIAGAKEITVTSDGRTEFTLPMAGSPTLAAMEACDTKPGPGEFSQE
ncbi:MAG: hypothetical protein ACR2JJ_11970 [Sphingomicrobium sp.]